MTVVFIFFALIVNKETRIILVAATPPTNHKILSIAQHTRALTIIKKNSQGTRCTLSYRVRTRTPPVCRWMMFVRLPQIICAVNEFAASLVHDDTSNWLNGGKALIPVLVQNRMMQLFTTVFKVLRHTTLIVPYIS